MWICGRVRIGALVSICTASSASLQIILGTKEGGFFLKGGGFELKVYGVLEPRKRTRTRSMAQSNPSPEDVVDVGS